MAAVLLENLCLTIIVVAVTLLVVVVECEAVSENIRCPLSCSCLGSMVDCSRKGLVEVPKELPHWVTILELQSNGISTIHEDAFLGLDKLERLDLSGNELTSVNETLFQNLPLLKDLKLNYNKFSEVPIFRKNSTLTHLFMHHNRVHNLSSSSLKNVPNLRVLDLSFNSILTIPTGVFLADNSLHQIFMTNNRIITMDKGALDNLTNVETLKLNKNKLFSFPKDLFAHLKKLKFLELNRNKFRVIQGLMFNGLDNLQSLKLRRNSITTLMDGSFWELGNMQHLSLDHNNITVVATGWLYGLASLQQLSLSHNKIRTIESDGWSFCKLLQELNLNNNELNTLFKGSFSELHVLQELHLDNNKLSHIELDAFEGLSSLQHLELNNNHISWAMEDSNGVFLGLDQLTRLGLDNNNMKSVSKEAFDGLSSMKHLHMTDNAITSIQENAFIDMVDLQELYFNTTNLLCDCKLGWLPKWLKKMSFENSVSAACSHPEWLQDKSIFGVDPDDYKCKDFPKPIMIAEPKSMIALKGDNVSLRCDAASSGSYPTEYQWRKDNIIVTDADIENFAQQDNDLSKYTSLLHLRNIQDDAEGEYQCIISNRFGSAFSSRAKIGVQVFPWFTKTPIYVTVKAGSTARLECAAHGQPPPEIAWQKDGGDDFPAARERRMHVMPTDDVFFIVNVKSSDEGVYSCTATNSAGMIIANASLTVLETPSFVRPMENKYTRNGQTTVMECLASGSPKPRLKWFKNGKPLEVTHRHFFAADNQLLLIVQTRASDAGTYTCEMSNTLGTERDKSILRVVAAGGDLPQKRVNDRESSQSSSDSEDDSITTEIIIIAVVCCVVGTSLVWVIIIYQTRKRHDDYSVTPTDETTLPGELPSSSCNSSEKEAAFASGNFALTGYTYHDFQAKESGYESAGYHSYGRARPAAIFPSDDDEDEYRQSVPLTMDEHKLARNSGENSESTSLHYPRSETDSMDSSQSTESTQMSGHDTLRTFHPIINSLPTNHDRLALTAPNPEPGVNTGTLVVHRYPSASSLDGCHGNQHPIAVVLSTKRQSPRRPTRVVTSPHKRGVAHDEHLHQRSEPPGADCIHPERYCEESGGLPEYSSATYPAYYYPHPRTASAVVHSPSETGIQRLHTPCPKDSESARDTSSDMYSQNSSFSVPSSSSSSSVFNHNPTVNTPSLDSCHHHHHHHIPVHSGRTNSRNSDSNLNDISDNNTIPPSLASPSAFIPTSQRYALNSAQESHRRTLDV